ncbi:MAG TPA: hypothetical protein VGN91_25795 [Bosea sp. (in: a-proteobacteria)]|jgi:hypothetical protein|nr:hypothetical protein [Bosea sp. (in: a-proteobacteria)]
MLEHLATTRAVNPPCDPKESQAIDVMILIVTPQIARIIGALAPEPRPRKPGMMR